MSKSYFDYLNEITKDELLEGLLGYGMFAEKIPPIFTSEPLFNYCIANGYSWLDKKAHSAISYESMRNISVPRILSIPYPTTYVSQCKFISDNWDDVLLHLLEKTESDTFKKSKIHIRKMQNRKELFEMNYKDFDSKYGLLETEISIGAKYVVKADISNCFPSIYTHAISWALAGIEEAKRNQKDSSKWYNQLDFYTRADNETHGILIGPHSSNLISEVILIAIDNELKEYKYTRCIDDYTCFVSSQQEAETFLIKLANALKKYDLLLNHKKTEILKLPLSSVESWVTALKSFEIPNEIGVTFLRRYLDTAIDLANETGNIAVINFIIKTLSIRNFKPLALEYYINTIHNLLLIFPYLLPIIEDNVFIPLKLKIDIGRIKKIANDIFEGGVKYNRFEAMSYAMYFAIKYNFQLRDDLLDKVKLKEDCIFMMLSYLHDIKFLRKIKPQYKDIAKEIQDDDFSKDKFWLFIYEVLPKEDIKDTCLRELKGSSKTGKKVSFIKAV
jgi:hypothetical protein